MKRLDEIKKRLSEATPGPWEPRCSPTWVGHDADAISTQACGPEITRKRDDTVGLVIQVKNDAEFIAHSRQDIEDLVKCVELMREALRDVLDSKALSEAPAYNYSEAIFRANEALAQVEAILGKD